MFHSREQLQTGPGLKLNNFIVNVCFYEIAELESRAPEIFAQGMLDLSKSLAMKLKRMPFGFSVLLL
jgi:hypothetical protein